MELPCLPVPAEYYIDRRRNPVQKKGAWEILDLEERTLDELKGSEGIRGTVTIGCGEFAVVETLAEICRNYQQKYPRVQIALHTATADTISEMMNKRSCRYWIIYGTGGYAGTGSYTDYGEATTGLWDAAG